MWRMCWTASLMRHFLYQLVNTIATFNCYVPPALPNKTPKQESTRHTEALDAITRHLGVGSYAQWDESTKQAWLLTELQGKRPLLPRGGAMSDLGFDATVQVLFIRLIFFNVSWRGLLRVRNTSKYEGMAQKIARCGCDLSRSEVRRLCFIRCAYSAVFGFP